MTFEEKNEDPTLQSVQSQRFYCLKAFAVLAIVWAHSGYWEIESPIFSLLFNRFAMFGVIGFFLTAGFYFHYEKYKTIGLLLKNKAMTLGIPWLIWGSVGWGIANLHTRQFFDLYPMFKWFIGSGTYLWFLSAISVCFIIGLYIPKRKEVYVGLFLLSLLSNFLTARGVINHSFFNVYLNVFNWVGYFVLGMLLRQERILERFSNVISSGYCNMLAVFFDLDISVLLPYA